MAAGHGMRGQARAGAANRKVDRKARGNEPGGRKEEDEG